MVSSLMTKSGLIMTILNAKKHGYVHVKPMANIHVSKVILSIWWDQGRIIFYEVMKPSETIIVDRYRKQMIKLERPVKDKRSQYDGRHDKIILQHAVQKALQVLNWEILPCPPYLPDIAPSDYHLFYPCTVPF